jgi:NADH:ubiquinone oxidoreductase subunit K
MSLLEPKTVLFLAALLFTAGLYGVLSRRNMIMILMCLELMLNAVNIALVTYSRHWAGQGAGLIGAHSGQFFTLMVMAVAAAEVGIGLAIVLLLYRNRASVNIDDADLMKY